MEDHSDFLPFENESNDFLIEKFEEMRSSGRSVYFDVEEIEDLVDYYLFNSNKNIVKDIIELGKSQHPYSVGIQLKEAEVLFYSDKVAEALNIVDEIELREDADPEHFFSKASIYSMADERDKAIALLQKLVEITDGEDREEAQMALAKEYQEMGDYHRAIEEYKNILKNNAESEDALLEMALSSELSLDYYEGIKLLEDFIDENPYSFYAWFSLGNMYLLLDDLEKAIHAFDYATVINEKFSEAYFNMANTLMKLERFSEAIEAFKNSMIDGVGDPITYNFIGHCYIVLDQNDTAIYYFRKSVEENPEYADGWLGLAVSHANMDDFQESLLYVEKAIKINPNNKYYLYFFGDTLFNLGDFKQAEKVYEQVYNSNLYGTGIIIDYTETLINNQKTEKAKEVLTRGITEFPDEPLLYYRYAALMLELGKEMDAESILMLALEIAPEQSAQLFKYFPEAAKFDGIMDLIENYK